MARPKKCRRVGSIPENTLFVPYHKKGYEIEEIILNIEELEAMRLKDVVKLNQEECADKMDVSRQTFQNILSSAREKVALALLEGRAINISGGNYIFKKCRLRCLDCDTVFDKEIHAETWICPACGNDEIICNKKGRPCFN